MHRQDLKIYEDRRRPVLRLTADETNLGIINKAGMAARMVGWSDEKRRTVLREASHNHFENLMQTLSKYFVLEDEGKTKCIDHD